VIDTETFIEGGTNMAETRSAPRPSRAIADRAPHARAPGSQVLLLALAAMALAACAPSTEPITAPVPTLSPVISMSTAPSTPAIPVAQHVTASGPFQSPSGNILCNMATYSTGGITTRCEVTNHDWVAMQPANCQQNWGDRVGMEQGSAAVFGCYGQKMRAATHTLEYGQIQTLGSISCDSETVGVMCIDNATGHYFFISRETVQLG
jgi:hypothetical protein